MLVCLLYLCSVCLSSGDVCQASGPAQCHLPESTGGRGSIPAQNQGACVSTLSLTDCCVHTVVRMRSFPSSLCTVCIYLSPHTDLWCALFIAQTICLNLPTHTNVCSPAEPECLHGGALPSMLVEKSSCGTRDSHS